MLERKEKKNEERKEKNDRMERKDEKERTDTVNPFTCKFTGINVCILGPATYSRELKFMVKL